MHKRYWLRVSALVIGVLILSAVGYFGWRATSTWLRWRHLDQTYTEAFAPPRELAPELEGRALVFHMKTGLDQDDSQICVGFNVILAALEAGANVTVVFDAGALLDLQGDLADTGVPLRLRKVIAAQLHLPLETVPAHYGAYLDLLHERGAKVYANTAMFVVTGDASQVHSKLDHHAYIVPAPYAVIAQQLAQADAIIVY